jgi:hypothetical protein
MRTKFPGQFRPSTEQFKTLWTECLFVPDSSVLLGLYQYSSAASDALLNVLEAVKDRLWMPHQAAKEYLEGRIGVIGKESKKYSEVKNQFQTVVNQIKSKTQHPFLDDALVKEIEHVHKKVDSALTSSKVKVESLIHSDPILEKVADLFDGKLGTEMSQEQLERVFKQGEVRYEKLIPPGFEDRKKDGNTKYGDLVIWFEMIEKAKSDKRHIVFLTNDAKCDWWLLNGDDKVGPRPELIEEFRRDSGQLFYSYLPDNFLKYAETNLRLTGSVDQRVINEIRDTRAAEEEEVFAKVSPQQLGRLLDGAASEAARQNLIENLDAVRLRSDAAAAARRNLIENLDAVRLRSDTAAAARQQLIENLDWGRLYSDATAAAAARQKLIENLEWGRLYSDATAAAAARQKLIENLDWGRLYSDATAAAAARQKLIEELDLGHFYHDAAGPKAGDASTTARASQSASSAKPTNTPSEAGFADQEGRPSDSNSDKPRPE